MKSNPILKAIVCLFLILTYASTLDAEEWKQAIGQRTWSFPRDHGAHPEFRTEWWYFTGNLRDEAGNRYGYQLTFFR
ncbi:MAG: lipocalin-like domain-containing protein, partial [Syntrophaceae bacterium]